MRSLGLILLAAVVSIEAQQTFRFGTISWNSCYAIVGTSQNGFYDRLFPQVCATRNNPLLVAVVVDVAFAINGNAGSSMLQFASTDINNYLAGTSRLLRVFRGTSQPQFSRRIGYRYGLGDAAYNPVVIDCPTTPCSPTADLLNYPFQIDRLSVDNSMVYARFVYEISLPSAGDYTAFFDGCCRPPQFPPDSSQSLNNAQGLFVNNNFNLPFHLRAEIRLSATDPTFPYASPRFGMPDMVVLRKGGLSGTACDSTPVSVSFQIQAYHPVKDYADFLSYRQAVPREMGQYKCLEYLDTSGNVVRDAATVATTSLAFYSGQCTSALNAVPQPPAGMTVSLGGLVTFPVSVAGVWQATIVATCRGCYGGFDGINVVDLLISVQDSGNDPNPPRATYNGTSVDSVTPQTSTKAPLRINCGRSTFALGSQVYNRIRVGFVDPDSGQTVQCSTTPNTLAWINQTNAFPTGLSVDRAQMATVRSSGYVDIAWTPQCEDVSQVGVFMLCFQARDTAQSSGFKSLVSVPSPQGGAPTCVFVESLPPLPNPTPRFRVPPTPFDQCSAGCCSCCGQTSCACQERGEQCCQRMLAKAGSLHQMYVQAVGDNTFVQLRIVFTYPEGGPAGGLPAGVSMPSELPLKYGCGTGSYENCVSAPATAPYDVAIQLSWNLANLSDYFCSASRVPCSGPGGLCTAAAGDQCVPRPVSQQSVAPFKVCYQAVQVVPPTANEELFRKVYGYTLTNNSCVVCFVLGVLSPPFFLTGTGTGGAGTPNNLETFSLAVGEQLSVVLLGGSINAGTTVTTVMLSDPGAPNGASLTAVRPVAASGVAQNTAYQRELKFRPTADQQGMSYRVCFQVMDSSGETSEVRCFFINVLPADVTWTAAPCPPFNATAPARYLSPGVPQAPACMPCALDPVSVGQVAAAAAAAAAAAGRAGGPCPHSAAMEVAVGCLYTTQLGALAPRYALTIGFDQLPMACPGCDPERPDAAVAACGGGGGDGACCGNGVCDGYESGDNCPSDCGAEDSSITPLAPVGPAVAQQARAEFQWRPGRTAAGRHILTCFTAAPPAASGAAVSRRQAAATSPTMCIVFRVARCRYCAPRGATLLSVAKHYLGLGWHTLYNANPAVRNPGLILQQQSLITGPTYIAQPGDTLLGVAGMAQTTVKTILEYNRDIPASGELPVNQPLCLVLCTAPAAPPTQA